MARTQEQKEKLRTIRLAMLEIARRRDLTEQAKQRGLRSLQQAYERARKEQAV